MEKLKYLFEVVYKDGTTFVQPENDISVKDEKRSAFFDVDQQEIMKFYIVEDVPKGAPQKVFAVDLVDGHFEINDIPFFMHDDRTEKDFRLIFFRRHKHGFNLEGQPQYHLTTYRIGWQYTEDGKNHQQIMEFN